MLTRLVLLLDLAVDIDAETMADFPHGALGHGEGKRLTIMNDEDDFSDALLLALHLRLGTAAVLSPLHLREAKRESWEQKLVGLPTGVCGRLAPVLTLQKLVVGEINRRSVF